MKVERNHLWSTSFIKAISLVVLVLSLYLVWRNLITLLILGSLISTFLVWLSFKASSVYAEATFNTYGETAQQKFPSLKFVSEVDWDIASTAAQTTNTNFEALFPESFLISQSIDDIVEYILADFVNSWYQRISQKDSHFVLAVRSTIRMALQRLGQRLKDADYANLIVLKLVPIINDHFQNFVLAEEIVRSKKKTVKDMDHAIASNFNKSKIHPALKLHSFGQEHDRKFYLQASMEALLPSLLPSHEIASASVVILLKNLLTSCVVFPSINMLCESDFWNQLIENVVGAILKDRYQVQKFRSVLDLHASIGSNYGAADFSKNSLMKTLLKTNTSQQQFDKICRKAASSKSVPELKQLHYYTGLQLSKSVLQFGQGVQEEVPADIKVYNKRLQTLSNQIERRLESLINENKFYQDNRSSKRGSLFKPESLPKNKNLDLTLNDILLNPTALTYFMEFMEQRSYSLLLQFWLTINGIRSPLEDLSGYEDAESDDEELVAMSLSLDLSQAEDIEQIFYHFFDSKTLRIDADNYENVAHFVQMEHKTLEAYIKARKSLLILQKEVYNRMERSHFIVFKESDFFLRLLSAEDLFKKDEAGDDLSDAEDPNYQGDPLANYDEPLSNDQVGDSVIKAVEEALNDIMVDDKNIKPSSDLSSRPSSTSLVDSRSHSSPVELQKEIFGVEADNGLFDELDTSYILSNSDSLAQKRNSRLFDDMTDSETEASENGSMLDSDFTASGDNAPISVPPGDSHVEAGISRNTIQLAAPGDLNLTELIENLSTEISKYRQQVAIIDPLLKKAEITNNVAELKILRKSKQGLEREIQSKELQKQQYIVQENDNSLYGKSRVRIQSYYPEKSFIMYIIEVQKLAADEKDKVTAGWIVSRRFSQFYKLNEYLRGKYPQVQQLTFPKKKVVLKFQQTALIEERRYQLELYLQSLLHIPDVCTDYLFRSFLSSEVFAVELNDSLNSSAKLNRRGKVENVANKLYSTLSYRMAFSGANAFDDKRASRNMPSPTRTGSSSEFPMRTAQDNNVTEMQRELNSFDDIGRTSFVKPICDLIISVFCLKKSNAWLRGRAIVVVLQQLLGSTIEKKTRDNLRSLIRSESRILDVVLILRDKLWPNGKFRESGNSRTAIEKSSTKAKAHTYIEKFMIDSTSKVFGVGNSKYAAAKIHGMLQNEFIMTNMIYSLYDEILREAFPEMINE